MKKFTFLFERQITPFLAVVAAPNMKRALAELAIHLPKIGEYSSNWRDYQEDVEQGRVRVFVETSTLGRVIIAMGDVALSIEHESLGLA